MRIVQEQAHNERWPDAVAYREAIQSPSLTIPDPTFADATVTLSRQGLPIAYTGRFAIVFQVADRSGARWAFRCFTSPQDPFGVPRAVRYHLIERYTRRADLPFVPFRYLERGIRVGSGFYPAVALGWAGGVPLGRFVEDRLHDANALFRLADALEALRVRLEAAGIAHGDWQHDNLIIDNDGDTIRLVDYDALFVPELAGYASSELGHPNYQHPARNSQHFGVGLDRFACLSMRTALLALTRQPDLWGRFGDGESLLFTASDFRDPAASPLFAALKAQAELDRDAVLAESIALLEAACDDPSVLDCLPISDADRAQPLPDVPMSVPIVRSQERPASAGVKWWSGSVGARGGLSVAGQTLQPHLIKLQEPGQLRAESRHLVLHRALLSALVVLLIWRLLQPAGGNWVHWLMLMTPLLWIAVTLAGGYHDWPRRRIRRELAAERTRMEKLIEERKARIEARSQQLQPGDLQAARGTAADYVAEKMGKLPINRILPNDRIPPATLRTLQAAGIETALDLSRRSNLPQIAPHQIAQLQVWCRELEAEYADEWRKTVAASRGIASDIQRLELENAEFEREIQRLDREAAQFPSTNLGAYVRRLGGLPS